MKLRSYKEIEIVETISFRPKRMRDVSLYGGKLIKTERDNFRGVPKIYAGLSFEIHTVASTMSEKRPTLSRIFLVAVHVFCCVIIKLAIARRAFSSWCPLLSSPSSTLNRIKVAGEKQVGINRAEERRAAA